MAFKFKTQGVCPSEINFAIEGETIKDLNFIGGCSGNLSALSKMINGKQIDEIIPMFKGHTCGARNNSCMNQLVVALEAARETM
ncbi:TIGR03905 family TSCPD domain-containing protein [Eubacteriaceae bacterium ES3]|nr:TIGR03905 family TSCPD domain-containing protein [Eubacteriaceae bacterium ES3]